MLLLSLLLSLLTCTEIMHRGSCGAPSNPFFHSQIYKHLLLADDLDQLIPHKTGRHQIYMCTKSLAASFTPSTNQAGFVPPFPSAESSQSSAQATLTEKDQHESVHKLITLQIRRTRAQKSSAQSSSPGSFRGKCNWQHFEPSPLVTVLFPVRRHGEKTRKQ